MNNASNESDMIEEMLQVAADRWQETEPAADLDPFALENALARALSAALDDLARQKAEIEDTLHMPAIRTSGKSEPREDECEDIIVSAIAHGLRWTWHAILQALRCVYVGAMWIKAGCDETWRSR